MTTTQTPDRGPGSASGHESESGHGPGPISGREVAVLESAREDPPPGPGRTLEHRPIDGNYWMHPQWCGGCEVCGPAPKVCDACSSEYEPLHPEASSDGWAPKETPVLWPCDVALAGKLCERCEAAPAVADCCSSHGKLLCHKCYRRTHFVERCYTGCPLCVAEELPVVLR